MDERDRRQSAPPSSLSSVPARFADGRDGDTTDTTPGAPALPAQANLHDDERYIALTQQASSSRAYLADRSWDNLAHIDHFARAATAARPLLADYREPCDRRAIAHLLFALLPTSSRARTFQPLDDAVSARAPDFRIRAGDVPRIAPVYSAFLARPDLVDHVLQPGAGPFLVGKSVCPGACKGNLTAIVVDALTQSLAGDAVRAHVPLALFRTASPSGPSGASDRLEVRTGPDGKPLLTVDGKTQPIIVTHDVVTAWIFSAGPDARGLDLRDPNERALLLSWAHALRQVDVAGRSAFAWLEDGGAPLGVRVDVVTACVNAAVDVIARYTLDPLACRISLRPDGGDGDWQRKAAALLDDTGLFHDVHVRDTASPDASPRDASVERDIVWADAILHTGFASGRLSAVAAGRAFARLATSALASLGVLPLSGLKDGSGGVVLQRLLPLDVTHASASSSPSSSAQPPGASLVPVPSAPPSSSSPPPSPSSPPSSSSLTSAPEPVAPRAVRLDAPRFVSFTREAGLAKPEVRELFQAWANGEGAALPDPRGAARHDVAAMPAWFAFFQEQLARSDPST